MSEKEGIIITSADKNEAEQPSVKRLYVLQLLINAKEDGGEVALVYHFKDYEKGLAVFNEVKEQRAVMASGKMPKAITGVDDFGEHYDFDVGRIISNTYKDLEKFLEVQILAKVFENRTNFKLSREIARDPVIAFLKNTPAGA